MNDPYPQEFSIKIEREKLCRYLRAKTLLSCTVFPFMGTFLGFVAGLGRSNQHHMATVSDLWMEVFLGVSIGALIGLLIGLAIYLVFGHRSARIHANAVEVRVEGQFLRVADGVMVRRDRKLHFRAIVDFAFFQGPLMRWCDIAGITMNTAAGGLHTIVNMFAVEDAMNVRDTLSRVDRLREDQEPS